MNLSVSMYAGIPIYEQLKDQIRHAILKKDLQASDKLPSVRILSKDLSIGIVTVKRAYDDLVNEGFIISQAGRGYFVNHVDIDKFKVIYRRKISHLFQDIQKLAKDVGLTEEEVLKLYYNHKEQQ